MRNNNPTSANRASAPQNMVFNINLFSNLFNWTKKVIKGLDDEKVNELVNVLVAEFSQIVESQLSAQTDELKQYFSSTFLEEMAKAQAAKAFDEHIFKADRSKTINNEAIEKFVDEAVTSFGKELKGIEDEIKNHINKSQDEIKNLLSENQARYEVEFQSISNKVDQILCLVEFYGEKFIDAIKATYESLSAQNAALRMQMLKTHSVQMDEMSKNQRILESHLVSINEQLMKLQSANITRLNDEYLKSFVEKEKSLAEEFGKLCNSSEGDASRKLNELILLQSKLSQEIYSNTDRALGKLEEISSILSRENCPLCGADLRKKGNRETCDVCGLYKKGDHPPTGVATANQLTDIFNSYQLRLDTPLLNVTVTAQSPFRGLSIDKPLIIIPNWIDRGCFKFCVDMLPTGFSLGFRTIIISRRVQEVKGCLRDYFNQLERIIIQPREGGLAIPLILSNKAFDGIKKTNIINGFAGIEHSSWINIKE